jgi:RNA polymerase sigma-70 factor (ECF subfamily)
MSERHERAVLTEVGGGPTAPRSGVPPAPRVADPLAPLVGRALAGDRAATGELLARVTPKVLQVVRGIFGASCPDEEDLAQECLVAFHRALGRFEGKSTVAHYARGIATRHCLQIRKRRAVRRRLFERMVLDEPPPLPHLGPEAEMVKAAQRRLLSDLLETLPAEQSETVALRWVAQMSLDEVAESTGVPVNTVRSRLRLAKQAIAARIESDPVLAQILSVASW